MTYKEHICPRCGAKIGFSCTDVRNSRRTIYAHAERMRLCSTRPYLQRNRKRVAPVSIETRMLMFLRDRHSANEKMLVQAFGPGCGSAVTRLLDLGLVLASDTSQGRFYLLTPSAKGLNMAGLPPLRSLVRRIDPLATLEPSDALQGIL